MNLTFQITSWQNEQKQTITGAVPFRPDVEEQENTLLNLYPQFTDQCWEGFGGAFTDSAGYVYSQMGKAQQEKLLHACFDPDGLNYQAIRVPIDSCDFSLEQYEAAPGGDLSQFSMKRAGKYILPMLSDAQRVAGRPLPLTLSPWSPPAAFKTNAERTHGGGCKRENWADWAEYLCRYIQEFQQRGFLVRRMTLQNEPKAVQTWDSCIWTAQEEHDFLVHYMKPALLRHHLEEIEVFFWDHNKERILERAIVMLDEAGSACADGVAFHWYSGDHFEALEQVHRLFPEKKLILSESCLEYSKIDVHDPYTNAERLAHEIIGNMKSGMNGFYDWNVLLDETGGPNYAGNFCHAPFLFDTKEGQLWQTSLYDSVRCMASIIQPGAVRILCSGYTGRMETVAFRNPDGSLAAIVLNHSGESLPLTVRVTERIADLVLPAHTITGMVLTE